VGISEYVVMELSRGAILHNSLSRGLSTRTSRGKNANEKLGGGRAAPYRGARCYNDTFNDIWATLYSIWPSSLEIWRVLIGTTECKFIHK